jgi:hypothetical protein
MRRGVNQARSAIQTLTLADRSSGLSVVFSYLLVDDRPAAAVWVGGGGRRDIERRCIHPDTQSSDAVAGADVSRSAPGLAEGSLVEEPRELYRGYCRPRP